MKILTNGNIGWMIPVQAEHAAWYSDGITDFKTRQEIFQRVDEYKQKNVEICLLEVTRQEAIDAIERFREDIEKRFSLEAGSASLMIKKVRCIVGMILLSEFQGNPITGIAGENE